MSKEILDKDQSIAKQSFAKYAEDIFNTIKGEIAPESTIPLVRRYKEAIEKASVFYKDRFNNPITKQKYDTILSGISDIDFDKEKHYESRRGHITITLCNGLFARQLARQLTRDIIKNTDNQEIYQNTPKRQKRIIMIIVMLMLGPKVFKKLWIYSPDNDKAVIFIKNKLWNYIKDQKYSWVAETAIHELSHGFDHIICKKDSEYNTISQYFIEELKAPFSKRHNKNDMSKRKNDYLTNPKEIYARIMEIRFKLWLKPSDIFDIWMLEKASTICSDNVQSMLSLLDGERWKIEFVKLMNTLY